MAIRPIRLVLDIDDADADGIADGNSSASTSVTLDGTLTSGGTYTSADGLAHQINITDVGADDQSGATYTLTGTDADGNSITEAVTGPTASATVESTLYYKTLTSVAIASPVAASTVDIGTVDEVATSTQILNYHNQVAPVVNVVPTGTINFTVQETHDNLYSVGLGSTNWAAITALSSKTANTTSQTTLAATGLRVITNSYTNGAELLINLIHPWAEA